MSRGVSLRIIWFCLMMLWTCLLGVHEEDIPIMHQISRDMVDEVEIK